MKGQEGPMGFSLLNVIEILLVIFGLTILVLWATGNLPDVGQAVADLFTVNLGEAFSSLFGGVV